jgi:PIN domain nuclease of toxin-antitoxin system
MILLDTHALLWWQAEGQRLSVRARRAIESASAILLSPVSFWEVGLLQQKGRIRLDRDVFDWARQVVTLDRLGLADLTPSAALLAALLPARGFQGDPADAFIYATAHQTDAILVTKDRRLRTFASEHRDVRTVW